MHVPNVGVIRSHPNFQGDGPWEDWVMISQRHGGHVQDVPALVCAFIMGYDDEGSFSTPMALIQRCNLMSKSDHQNFKSVILQRYSKAYTAAGEPLFDIVFVNEIKEVRLVLEDTPVLMDLEDDWATSMENQEWLRDEPPTLCEGIKPALYEWHQTLLCSHAHHSVAMLKLCL